MIFRDDFKTHEMNDNVFFIQLLGDFVIDCNHNILSGEKLHAKQVWNLLECLIVNRKKETSLDTFIEILWNEKEVEDPANALKNLVYRLRTIMKKTLKIDSKDYIVYKYGSYAWNTEMPCIVDVDLFEEYIKQAQKAGIKKALAGEYYYKAFRIYQGNFLPQSEYKEWIRPMVVYYQRLYMNVCKKLCEFLMEQERYDIVEEVCRRAITVDPYVEVNHINLMKALIASKNQQKALAHYNKISKMFYDEIGMPPSETITTLYKDAINRNFDFEKNIAVIKGDLEEIRDVNGILQCNYETFKSIYRFQARAALRNGKSFFIALLTVTSKNGDKIPSDQLKETLDYLMQTLYSFLRKDDIVTRYGRTQFLIMLSNITCKNTSMVLNRLVNRINKSAIGNRVEVYGQVEAVDSLKLNEKINQEIK